MQMMICRQKTWPVICWDAREGSNRRARPRRASRWRARLWRVFLFDRIFGGMIFGQVMANKSHGGRSAIFDDLPVLCFFWRLVRTISKKRFRLFLGFRVFLGSSLGCIRLGLYSATFRKMDSLDFPRWKVFLLDSRFSFLWAIRAPSRI